MAPSGQSQVLGILGRRGDTGLCWAVASDRNRTRCRDRLARIGAATLDCDSLRHEVVAELKRVVGFDRWAWPLADPDTLIPLAGIAEHDYGPAVPRLLELEYSVADFAGMTALAGRPVPAASLTVETGDDRSRSRRWDEVLRNVGIGDEAIVACRDRFGCWGWLKAYRSSDDRPFAEPDVEMLADAGPILGAALRRSLARDRRAGEVAARPPGLVLLDDELRPLAETAAWRSWVDTLPAANMYAAFQMLPAMVYPVATLARSRDGTSGFRALERATDGSWVVVEAAALEGNGNATIAVTLRRATPHETFDRLCRLCALTSRERQVVAALLTGVDTRSASADLAISHHTVQDHLKSVFAKVGIRSRRELVARFSV
jgi:DNA-binding CsgD family transcriptional regulator